MINTMELAAHEDLTGLDLFQNCRLCLAKDKVSVDIFSEGHEVRLLYYKIVSCLPVHVTQDDKLPRKICTQCNEKVDNFYQFWTLTAKSQKTLLDWVEKKDLLPPSKIKTENVPAGEIAFKQEAPDYSDEDNDNDNDRYEDDNSDEEMEPSTFVKVCEETDETAGGTTPGPSAGTKIKLEDNVRFENNVLKVKSDALIATFKSKNRNELRCRLCGCLSATVTQAVVHFLECKKNKDKVYECTVCKRTYFERSSLIKHLKSSHNIHRKSIRRNEPEKNDIENDVEHSPFPKYQCDFCGNQWKTVVLLQRHIKDKHLRTSGKKKSLYPCSFCSKKYTSAQTKRLHESIHKLDERLQCAYCDKNFACKTNLAIHIKNIHLKSEQEKRMVPPKKFICDICGNGYCRKSGLKEHYKKEHEEGGKPTCKICDKVLSDKKSMEIHMNTHAGLKPYCCVVCGRCFTTDKYLRVHGYSHTGEFPHVCHICPKKFRQRSSYTFHYKTNHPGIAVPKLR